jgi:hypothetical protein
LGDSPRHGDHGRQVESARRVENRDEILRERFIRPPSRAGLFFLGFVGYATAVRSPLIVPFCPLRRCMSRPSQMLSP